MTVRTLEPKGCPFPKGKDGLCTYHRRLFGKSSPEDNSSIQYWKLLGVIFGKRRIHG